MERLIESPIRAQEKITFWHGHFATGYRPVEDVYFYDSLRRNWKLFRNNAFGNFKKDDLVHPIIR